MAVRIRELVIKVELVSDEPADTRRNPSRTAVKMEEPDTDSLHRRFIGSLRGNDNER